MAKRGNKRNKAIKQTSLKKNDKNNISSNHNGNHHPRLREQLTFGQKAADSIAGVGGSWAFIIGFMVFLVSWMILNVYLLRNYGDTWDAYPFILLNLILSCLAAIQAPIILMAQNRQAERDRIDAGYDHSVNRKAEREIQALQRELSGLRTLIKQIKK